MLMGSYRVHFHMSPMPELAYLQHQENKILVRRRAASAVARGVSRVWCVFLSGQAALFRNDRSIMSCMSASVGDQCGPWARARGPTWVPRVVCPGRRWGCCRPRGEKLAHHPIFMTIFTARFTAQGPRPAAERAARETGAPPPRRRGDIGAPVLGGVLEPRGGSCALC